LASGGAGHSRNKAASRGLIGSGNKRLINQSSNHTLGGNGVAEQIGQSNHLSSMDLSGNKYSGSQLIPTSMITGGEQTQSQFQLNYQNQKQAQMARNGRGSNLVSTYLKGI